MFQSFFVTCVGAHDSNRVSETHYSIISSIFSAAIRAGVGVSRCETRRKLSNYRGREIWPFACLQDALRAVFGPTPARVFGLQDFFMGGWYDRKRQACSDRLLASLNTCLRWKIGIPGFVTSSEKERLTVDVILNASEIRVVGALIEKQLTTPDYYPLTLNALIQACNQLSNREPVVSFDEETVRLALDGLREKRVTRVVTGGDHRVLKYKHVFPEAFLVTPPELAILCVLMLRGPQTIGELRGRTGRLYNFADLAEVETTLQGLMARERRPLVTQLERQPGQKESRYAHVLSGDKVVPEQSSRPAAPSDHERIPQLEAELELLRQEIAELRQQFVEFRKIFE